MTSSRMLYTIKKKLPWKAKYQLQGECSKYYFKEVGQQNFQNEKKSIFVQNPDVHFILKISINLRLYYKLLAAKLTDQTSFQF